MSQKHQIPKPNVVRERLRATSGRSGEHRTSSETIADLIGSVDGLPADLGARRKVSLKKTGYGRKRDR